MSDFFDNWTVQLRKGLLELCILNSLVKGERYAYDLVRSMVNVPGLGLTEGTIYPLLSRLRSQGLVKTRLVESNEGPARKYYCLSKEGERELEQMNRYFEALMQSSQDLSRKGTP